eukprot:TRINITY_DN4484_c0_g1_i1.p1 TRINITY_DN4484_c0_g1~~TRINITY_DN4484_c0_g1_i1.p1  ORF type:complete len:339 (-),score=74.11 TRINITY_DN4484_c0_g1_i1:33-1049(-)
MSLFIYFLIFLIILCIYLKSKEKSVLSRYINTKTGKQIPSYTMFQSLILIYQRFGLKEDAFTNVRKMVKEKGETFGTFFGGSFFFYLTNANDIKTIASSKNIEKSDMSALFTPLIDKYLGKSLLMLNDETWAIQRKTINNALGYSKIKSLVPIFHKMAGLFVEKIKTKTGYIDMFEMSTLITFDVIGKTGFGYDFHSLDNAENEKLNYFKKIMDSFFNFPSILFKSHYDNLPLKNNKILKNACDNVDKWIDNIIEERREKRKGVSNNDNKSKDLLDFILDSETEEDVHLDNRELKSNIFLFFFAGHDTSASTITSVLYFLAKHPDYIKKAQEEIKSTL